MTEKVQLRTRLETLEQLHDLADGRRTKIRVEAEDLQNLIIDHHNMFTLLQKKELVKEPGKKRARLQ